jgi:hypothetical protein
MTQRAPFALLVTVTLLMLPGCNRRYSGELGHPVKNEARKREVFDASIRLREMFNNSECDSIYRGADVEFRRGSESQWKAQYQDLRKRLGEWRNLGAQRTISCSTDNSQICINGLACATGTYPLQSVWKLDGARISLFALIVGNPRALILNWSPAFFEHKPVAPCDSDFCSA